MYVNHESYNRGIGFRYGMKRHRMKIVFHVNFNKLKAKFKGHQLAN